MLVKDNEESNNNKRWLHRLNLVITLSEWVDAHLSDHHIIWENQPRNKKLTRQGRFMKASQYVYGHLMLGRMLFPEADPDPLFCAHDYPNESMSLQLQPDTYPLFQAQVQHARLRVLDPTNLAKIPRVTWAMVCRRISNESTVTRLEQFAVKHSLTQPALISLVLRYLCIGGLDDNLHASIPNNEPLGSGCVECFASPFNHKCSIYYSLFEEDRFLGSQGNFFKAVAAHGGVLPLSHHRFEMNPPWINVIIERLVEIVRDSLAVRSNLQIIILAPHWVNTRWTPAFDALLAQYSRHVAPPDPKDMMYVHDLCGSRLFLRTVSWVFGRDFTG